VGYLRAFSVPNCTYVTPVFP